MRPRTTTLQTLEEGPAAAVTIDMRRHHRQPITAGGAKRTSDRQAHDLAVSESAAFASAYARFGAQRNTRLVGLWVRLLKRDGKPQYLAHMARTWDYLARNLAHPELRGLKAWYDTHFPESVRKQPVKA